MSQSSPLDTLFMPFVDKTINWPTKTLFMGAQPHSFLDGQSAASEMWQYFKPMVKSLADRELISQPDFPKDNSYKLILCLMPKQVEEAKFWIAQALSVLSDGGTLVAAAANDAGGARLPKWLKEAGFGEIYTLSKHKSRSVWGIKPLEISPVVTQWHSEGCARVHDFGEGLFLFTQPGLFSWNRIDLASRLLVTHLPADINGRGVDLGCGWGFLSHYVLKNFPAVTGMTLVDADIRALTCAQANTEGVRDNRSVNALWHDATTESPDLGQCDFVIMNPPFHEGKKTDSDIGKKFIQTASAHLRKNGKLYMVANAHLPYEEILHSNFSRTSKICEEAGFKILEAVK